MRLVARASASARARSRCQGQSASAGSSMRSLLTVVGTVARLMLVRVLARDECPQVLGVLYGTRVLEPSFHRPVPSVIPAASSNGISAKAQPQQ